MNKDRVILLIKDNQKSRIIADPPGSKFLKAACLLGAVEVEAGSPNET